MAALLKLPNVSTPIDTNETRGRCAVTWLPVCVLLSLIWSYDFQANPA